MGGASSRTVFTQIVKQLKTTDVDPNDQDFWDDLWKTTLTVEDIFELITPDDVRAIIADRPSNLKTLFTQAVAQLYQVVETPYPVYFDQALNCMRILSRVLPFMLESDSKAVKDLFWARQRVPRRKDSVHALPPATPATPTHVGKPGSTPAPKGGLADPGTPPAPPSASAAAAAEGAIASLMTPDGSAANGTTINGSSSSGGGDVGSSNTTSHGPSDDDEAAEHHDTEPVAVILVNAMLHLLFLPDFTIEDPNVDFTEDDVR